MSHVPLANATLKRATSRLQASQKSTHSDTHHACVCEKNATRTGEILKDRDAAAPMRPPTGIEARRAAIPSASVSKSGSGDADFLRLAIELGLAAGEACVEAEP
jgi:hypothetical protein